MYDIRLIDRENQHCSRILGVDTTQKFEAYEILKSIKMDADDAGGYLKYLKKAVRGALYDGGTHYFSYLDSIDYIVNRLDYIPIEINEIDQNQRKALRDSDELNLTIGESLDIVRNMIEEVEMSQRIIHDLMMSSKDKIGTLHYYMPEYEKEEIERCESIVYYSESVMRFLEKLHYDCNAVLMELNKFMIIT